MKKEYWVMSPFLMKPYHLLVKKEFWVRSQVFTLHNFQIVPQNNFEHISTFLSMKFGIQEDLLLYFLCTTFHRLPIQDGGLTSK